MDVGLSKLGEREAETAGEALLASGFRFHLLKMQFLKIDLNEQSVPSFESSTYHLQNILTIMIMIIYVTHCPYPNDNDQADNSIHLVTSEGSSNT